MNVKRRSLVGAFLSISIGLVGCGIFDPSEGPKKKSSNSYTLSNFQEMILGSGYERPTGMSSSNNGKGLSKKSGSSFVGIDLIFAERPTFHSFAVYDTFTNFDTTFVDSLTPDSSVVLDTIVTSYTWIDTLTGPLVLLKPTTISKIDTSFLQIENIYEFSGENIDDFKEGLMAGPIDASGNALFYRSRGLSLETAVLDSSSVLVASSASKKLFKIATDVGMKEIYKEDEELIASRDIIKDNDGKIYIVQAPLYSIDEGVYSIERPKRVISLDSFREISVEFELPDVGSIHFLWGVSSSNTLYGGSFYQMGEQLQIVENSTAGKARNDVDFYVSDLLDNRIYSASKDTVGGGWSVGVFAENFQSPPLDMVTAQNGNLYVITTALLDSNKNVAVYPSIIQITPEGAQTTVYTLSSSKLSNIFENIAISGQSIGDYIFPRVYNISAAVFEDSTMWRVYLTDSHTGEVKIITADK